MSLLLATTYHPATYSASAALPTPWSAFSESFTPSSITRQAWVVRDRHGRYLAPSGLCTASPNLAWQCQLPETAARLLRDGEFGDPADLRLECLTFTTFARYAWNWRAHDPALCI